jgi:hypothetical protein
LTHSWELGLIDYIGAKYILEKAGGTFEITNDLSIANKKEFIK